MNPLNATRYGFYWKYNVWNTDTGVPFKDMGRVVYVVDGFGNMVLTNVGQISASLA